MKEKEGVNENKEREEKEKEILINWQPEFCSQTQI
jgi:hypothetical protein